MEILLKSFYFVIFLISLTNVESFVITKADDELFPVAIIHLNDFHARFEETDIWANSCDEGEKCIGGYARIVSKVKELKEKHAHENPIYLNAGDNFQGTLWYNLLKWNVTSTFLNMLPADAMTIGNHEFDHGIEGVVPFLEAIGKETPIVVSNMDDSEEPTMNGLYKKSTIIEKYERKIGVIGTILSTTNQIARTEKLQFFDEATHIKIEAQLLKQQGVNIIIVLSHCGLDVDRMIAEKVGNDVDIIVGGHSHTFMYTGDNPPGPDTPQAEYPETVVDSSGNKVLIVQAAALAKYVGEIVLWFDKDGKVIKYEGAPVYLDNSVIPDPEIVEAMKPYKEEIDVVAKVVIGSSFVELDARPCNFGDCNIGNLITDSFVDWYAKKPTLGKEWTLATIALTNVGGIRTSLNAKTLNYGDLKTVIPFDNTIDMIDLKGEDLWDTIEYSLIKSFNAESFVGAHLLQVSGLKIVANVTNEIGHRLLSVDVLCRECNIPEYRPLNKTEIYKIIATSFLVQGGDGFEILRDKHTNHEIGDIDIDAFEAYVKKKSPIMTSIDGRLKILT